MTEGILCCDGGNKSGPSDCRLVISDKRLRTLDKLEGSAVRQEICSRFCATRNCIVAIHWASYVYVVITLTLLQYHLPNNNLYVCRLKGTTGVFFINANHLQFDYWLRRNRQWLSGTSMPYFIRGQVWPLGIVAACVCLCVSVSVCPIVCVRQPRACPRQDTKQLKVSIVLCVWECFFLCVWPWTSRADCLSAVRSQLNVGSQLQAGGGRAQEWGGWWEEPTLGRWFRN